MAFSTRNSNMPQKGTLAYHEQQSASARGTLFTVLALTLINIVAALLSDEASIFLFSSWLPLDLACCAKDIYAAGGQLPPSAIIIVVVFMLALLLCAIFWKKKPAAPAGACVLYFLDCMYILPGLFEKGPGWYKPTAAVTIFHVLVMILLIVGVINEAKARKLRKEAEAAPSFVAQEFHGSQSNGPEL